MSAKRLHFQVVYLFTTPSSSSLAAKASRGVFVFDIRKRSLYLSTNCVYLLEQVNAGTVALLEYSVGQ